MPHIEQPTNTIVKRVLLVTALSEGSSGYWDDCGPTANTAVGRINHLLPDSEYDGATIANIRTRDIEAGRFRPGEGQTLDDIRWDIQTFSQHQHVESYIPYFTDDAVPLNQLHIYLEQQAGTNACLVQVLNAEALPKNQPGVHIHFICFSGLDSTLGYFLINGDQINATAAGGDQIRYPGVWCTWDQLVAAVPCGLITVARNPGSPWV